MVLHMSKARAGARPAPDQRARRKARPVHGTTAIKERHRGEPGARIPSLGLEAQTALALADKIHVGLRKTQIERFSKHSGLSSRAIYQAAHVPPSTASKQLEKGRLKSHESERIARLARVFDQAADIFEDRGIAMEWLRAENSDLDGRSPLEAAGYDEGARAVEQLLDRMLHGTF